MDNSSRQQISACASRKYISWKWRAYPLEQLYLFFAIMGEELLGQQDWKISPRHSFYWEAKAAGLHEELPRDHFYKKPSALVGVAQWIEHWPVNQRVTSSIPSQGTCLGCRPGPQQGTMWEATTQWCLSPSLSPFIPFCLKINKYNLKKRRKRRSPLALTEHRETDRLWSPEDNTGTSLSTGSLTGGWFWEMQLIQWWI